MREKSEADAARKYRAAALGREICLALLLISAKKGFR